MSPQFVDFNADGHIDMLAGTFGGYAQVSYGSDKGFRPPETLRDSSGSLIVLNQFWNKEHWKWDDTSHKDVKKNAAPLGHMTSALAFDWDNDGDFDLLMGCYKSGRMYLRENKGTNAFPEFVSKNQPIMDGEKPLQVSGKLYTPRLVDWDKDGDQDLVCSSVGGHVILYTNEGKVGEPSFTNPKTLISASEKVSSGEPNGPEKGMYAEVVDWDNDGDWDLVVGGKSYVTPKAPELSEEQQARVKELNSQIADLSKKRSAIYAECMEEAGDREADDWRDKYSAAIAKRRAEINAISTEMRPKQLELNKLVPRGGEHGHIWLYRNITEKDESEAMR